MSTPTLLSSPLQGFTDFRFRNTFQKYFGGIDTFYSPYIRLNGKLDIKNSYRRDILPENNNTLTVIPQIMTNDPEEFLFVSKFVQSQGYKELNWNLGCPYPMVTKRCMGSGLINDPARIDALLDRVHSESDITVSMKMRMGYEHAEEILDVFPVLEKYPIKNVAIHARIGKQLYKGGVDLDAFEKCLNNSKQDIYYNGDIVSLDSYLQTKERFPCVKHWMIGRGLISDPFLPQLIKNNSCIYPENKLEIFKKFHDTLFHEFESALSGSSHVLIKMLHYWEYFSTSFTNSRRCLKKIKKAKNIRAYEIATRDIFNNEEYVGHQSFNQ